LRHAYVLHFTPTATTLISEKQGGQSSKHVPTYKLKFEDDDDQEHAVSALWVVEWPGS
jgi:SAGA-associated factor 29